MYRSDEAEIYMVYNKPINEQLCSFKFYPEMLLGSRKMTYKNAYGTIMFSENLKYRKPRLFMHLIPNPSTINALITMP